MWMWLSACDLFTYLLKKFKLCGQGTNTGLRIIYNSSCSPSSQFRYFHSFTQNQEQPGLVHVSHFYNVALLAYLFKRLATEKPSLNCKIVCKITDRTLCRKLWWRIIFGDTYDTVWLDSRQEDLGCLKWGLIVNVPRDTGHTSPLEVAKSVFTALRGGFLHYICPTLSAFSTSAYNGDQVTSLYWVPNRANISGTTGHGVHRGEYHTPRQSGDGGHGITFM
ncbi:hypothetical protein Pelo_9708 [Pelomyxa schiedti]|nr:hypothetical protein Pelo_9708 [Pelomyxa schiedti]